MAQDFTNPQLEIRGVVKQKRRWPIVTGISVGVLALALAGSGWAYATHYSNLALPHTMVGNHDVGGQTPDELKRGLTDRCQTLKATFSGDIPETSLSLGQMGLDCDVPGTAAAVMKANQNLSGVLASTVRERQVTPLFTLDKTAATQAARALTAKRPDTVVDPHLGFNSEQGSFAVQPGSAGQGVDPTVLIAAAEKTWKTQTKQSIKVKLTEVAPSEADPQLDTWAQQANSLIAPTVNLIGRRVGHIISPADKAQWVEVTENGPVISQKQVLAWLKTFTDQEIDVNNSPGERTITKDGYLLTMTKMALDSKKVSNNDTIAAEITTALNSGQNYRGVFEMEVQEGKFNDTVVDQNLPRPPYNAKPGEKFISIDLTNHTVAAWVGDKVVWGPVEAVHGSLPSPTHPGIFRIQTKLVNAHMKNEKAWDGPYDTWSPWTMYYHGGYAVHGTYTRWNWVQTNYGGSHGCVNLKPAKAKELFDWARVGTPVVIHRAGVI
ncbi:L,D-transpeptidase [uncultured Mobiluncus sp.]|uniref:L,D-transpeptidase n=1 Tax=uncultured Mobiluncus sp. TaxID=293425 RepID=UPI002621989C|nr:L,D-transpeptidase [uncultured Mobiluncus sp.]